MSRTAKLFQNGRSQAVRLPAEYRFEGAEVYIRRDPVTGDVVLSRKPESWQEFFDLMKTIEVPDDFMVEREDSPPRSLLIANGVSSRHQHG
jgi:antitoxin VapB